MRVGVGLEANEAEPAGGLAEHFPRSKAGLPRSVDGRTDGTTAEREK